MEQEGVEAVPESLFQSIFADYLPRYGWLLLGSGIVAYFLLQWFMEYSKRSKSSFDPATIEKLEENRKRVRELQAKNILEKAAADMEEHVKKTREEAMKKRLENLKKNTPTADVVYKSGLNRSSGFKPYVGECKPNRPKRS